MRLFWPPAILLGGQRLIATLGKVSDREAPLRQGQRYCTGCFNKSRTVQLEKVAQCNGKKATC
jgi:hypothetical protein